MRLVAFPSTLAAFRSQRRRKKETLMHSVDINVKGSFFASGAALEEENENL
jgi:hypothetical protein